MLQIRVQDELLWKAYPIEPQVPESLDSLCCSLLNRPNCEVDNYGQVNDGEDRQTTSSSSSTRVSWIMPCDASKSCNRGSKGLAELPSLQPPNTFTRSWAARDSQRARILLCPPADEDKLTLIVDDRHLLPVGYLCHACLFGCAALLRSCILSLFGVALSSRFLSISTAWASDCKSRSRS